MFFTHGRIDVSLCDVCFLSYAYFEDSMSDSVESLAREIRKRLRECHAPVRFTSTVSTWTVILSTVLLSQYSIFRSNISIRQVLDEDKSTETDERGLLLSKAIIQTLSLLIGDVSNVDYQSWHPVFSEFLVNSGLKKINEAEYTLTYSKEFKSLMDVLENNVLFHDQIVMACQKALQEKLHTKFY